MAECVINAAAAAVETGTRRRLLSSKTTEPVSSKQFGQLAFYMPGGHPHNLPAMTSSSRRMKAARALCWLSARVCDFVIGLSGTSVVLLEMNSLTSQFEGVHMNINTYICTYMYSYQRPSLTLYFIMPSILSELLNK